MIKVTAAVFECDDMIMAARRANGKHLAGFWEFPGGKLEQGETEEECLARELFEEFGVEVVVGDFVTDSRHDYGDVSILLLAYKVQLVSGSFTLRDHDEICWLPITRLRELEWAPADLPVIHALEAEYSALQTVSYYDDHPQAYFDETLNNDMSVLRDRFLAEVSPSGRILDLGCGSGRDSKFFLDRGFDVVPMDASEPLAKLAQNYLGCHVQVSNYQELSGKACFDGIWACASLLHCPEHQIYSVFSRCVDALRSRGVFYFSFKSGVSPRVDSRGRFFNDYTLTKAKNLIARFSELTVIDVWEEEKPLRGANQYWINGLVRKCDEAL
ncbi:NUDIX domain-containing protein [Aestuariirhabdus sp. LZHN29]|uniref:NUDIX domain-containing protein n=1 Tax=Aestuariirhabdus sp. LZHN29 TaxID=3417462 RepID=UPI003CEA4EFC